MRVPDLNIVVDSNAIEAAQSVSEALEGDMSLVAKRLRSGALLSDEERNLLADHAEGILKRPAHRAATEATRRRRRQILEYVYIVERMTGDKREAVVACAMAHYGVSRRTVFGILNELKADPHRERVFGQLADIAAKVACNGLKPTIETVTARWAPEGATFSHNG